MATYKAFEGANGWYVAAVLSDGSHHQPSLGPWLTKEEARRDARAKNDAARDEVYEDAMNH